MAHKLYNTKFVVTNMTKIVVCQLHNDWLQMTRFLVVNMHEVALHEGI
jgi:uncharacterized protein YhbP (UPF0306 family)